jgi:DNA invertase Pin-like site-specific DNA recombinase
VNIGYARVSANHQNLDRQIALLKRAGCKQIFREKQSGREGIKRPQLEKVIDALSRRDVLIVAEWDRATRSLLDGIRIIVRVAAKGAMLKALDRQWLDLTTPLGKGILAFLSALAEDECARILARATSGRAAARKRGVKFSPKPKLAPHQEREAVRMVYQDGQSLRAVATQPSCVLWSGQARLPNSISACRINVGRTSRAPTPLFCAIGFQTSPPSKISAISKKF